MQNTTLIEETMQIIADSRYNSCRMYINGIIKPPIKIENFMEIDLVDELASIQNPMEENNA